MDNLIIKKGKYKNIAIKINKFGQIKVLAPAFCSDKIIDDLINRKKDWIKLTLAKIEKNNENRIKVENNQILYMGEIYNLSFNPIFNKYYKINYDVKCIYTGKDFTKKDVLSNFYKKQARLMLPARIKYLAQKHNITINKITIRKMTSRWGSYSSSKNITLNEKLILCPLYVIDAVIYHEFTHAKIMNHSKKFYNELEKICPSYKQADKWLNTKMPVEYP